MTTSPRHGKGGFGGVADSSTRTSTLARRRPVRDERGREWLAVHGIGGIGLIVSDKGRLAAQQGAKTNTGVKTVCTVAAGFATVAGGLAGAAILRHADEGGKGVTEPSANASDELAAAQRVEKVTPWAIPLLTGVLVVLNAQQGEQQRPVAGWVQDAANRAKRVARH